MITLAHCRTAIAAAALLGAGAVFADTMSRPEYKAAKERIEVDLKADKAACASVSGNARDICHERASGKASVARAELQYRQSGKAADANKVAVANADATWAVARETCDDLAGQAKSVCVTEGRTRHTKALADARLDRKVGAAKADAVDDKREADRKLADEKCESLAGDAKSSCLDAARARFGKS